MPKHRMPDMGGQVCALTTGFCGKLCSKNRRRFWCGLAKKLAALTCGLAKRRDVPRTARVALAKPGAERVEGRDMRSDLFVAVTRLEISAIKP
jgi:hypothetical protein